MLQCYNVAKLQNQSLHSSMHKNLTALIFLFRIFFCNFAAEILRMAMKLYTQADIEEISVSVHLVES